MFSRSYFQKNIMVLSHRQAKNQQITENKVSIINKFTRISALGNRSKWHDMLQWYHVKGCSTVEMACVLRNDISVMDCRTALLVKTNQNIVVSTENHSFTGLSTAQGVVGSIIWFPDSSRLCRLVPRQ